MSTPAKETNSKGQRRPPRPPRQPRKEQLKKEIRIELQDAQPNKQLQKKMQNMEIENNKLKRAIHTFKQNRAVNAAYTPTSSDMDAGAMMEVTQFSNFLKSMLLPGTGAAHIPDDVIRPHMLHSEPVTYSVGMNDPSAAPGSTVNVNAVLLLFPDHPTSLIGYVYIYNQLNAAYEYAQTLTTALQLNTSFDYGRKVSEIITVRSNALPSGVFTIAGSMNAIRVEGTLSELALQTAGPSIYGTILANNTSTPDKVGGVGVVKGIAILSLPEQLNCPYTRLSDPTPVSEALTVANDTVNDASQDLKYYVEISGTTAAVAPGDTIDIFNPSGSNIFTMDVDSTTSVELDIQMSFAPDTVPAFLTSTGYIGNITFTADWLDPFGNAAGPSSTGVVPVNWPLAADPNLYTGNSMLSWTVNHTSDLGPVAAVQISAVFEVGNSQPACPTGIFGAQITATALNGARPGVNNPCVIVAVDDITAGTTLLIAGTANFELIPNPAFRKVVNTSYGIHSPGELEYVKTILANRRNLGVLSVWPLDEYMQAQDKLLALCNAAVHRPSDLGENVAFGWKDLVKFAKQKIAPAAMKGLKEFGSQALQSIASSAASGVPIVRALTEAPSAEWAHNPHPSDYCSDDEDMFDVSEGPGSDSSSDDEVHTPVLPPALQIRRSGAQPRMRAQFERWQADRTKVRQQDADAHNSEVHASNGNPQRFSRGIPVLQRPVRPPVTSKRTQTKPVLGLASRAVAFPTVREVDGKLDFKHDALYVVVPGLHEDHAKYCFGEVASTPTYDSHCIIGVNRGTPFPISAKQDFTVLAVNPRELLNGTIALIKSPPVTGASCDGAVWLLANGEFQGLYPFVVTGEVKIKDGRAYLDTNPVYAQKASYVRQVGFPILANNKDADANIAYLSDAVRPPSYFTKPKPIPLRKR